MHDTIAAITSEMTRTVPPELKGTRAAIFFLMGPGRVDAPSTVTAEVGAAFGRTMRIADPNARPFLRPVAPRSEAKDPTPTQNERRHIASDDFVFQTAEPQPQYG